MGAGSGSGRIVNSPTPRQWVIDFLITKFGVRETRKKNPIICVNSTRIASWGMLNDFARGEFSLSARDVNAARPRDLKGECTHMAVWLVKQLPR